MAFPIHHALRDESAPQEKVNALRSKSGVASKRNALRSKSPDFPILDAASFDSDQVNATQSLRPELSWTHYRLLLGIEDPVAREWYMREAVDEHWSTRQLERQISVLYYERLLASRRKAPVRKEAVAKLSTVEPEQFIRDPYVLEFLDLKDYPALRESAVEQAIIDNLQAFLLELIETIFRQPYTKGQFLVDAGIARRQTAAEYLKELERIGILKPHKIGKETLFLNVDLYGLLSK